MPQVARMPSRGLYGKEHAPAGLSPGFTGRFPLRTYPTMVMGFWVPLQACMPCGGLRAAGVVGGRPREWWPATVVRGVWCQALSLPRPPALWSGQPGVRDPCVPGAVGAGVGTLHRPHGARPCGQALRAVGVAVGRPDGGCRPPL